MTGTSIEINLDNILEIALRGVRRAAVFMGFGVNAALDTEFTNYQLTHLTNIQLVPNVPPEALEHFKDEFKIWIEANGFRELVETFSKYLDSLHNACLLIKNSNNDQQAEFEKEGFPNKLNILSSRFSIHPKHIEFLKSLYKARNCLTHRTGTVGQHDVNTDEDLLSVTWLGLDFFVQTPSGEKHLLNEIPEDGFHLPEGGTINIQIVERKRVFPIGSQVKFLTRDLAEICWYFDIEARSTLESTINFAKASGIPINNKAS